MTVWTFGLCLTLTYITVWPCVALLVDLLTFDSLTCFDSRALGQDATRVMLLGANWFAGTGFADRALTYTLLAAGH